MALLQQEETVSFISFPVHCSLAALYIHCFSRPKLRKPAQIPDNDPAYSALADRSMRTPPALIKHSNPSKCRRCPAHSLRQYLLTQSCDSDSTRFSYENEHRTPYIDFQESLHTMQYPEKAMRQGTSCVRALHEVTERILLLVP